jgi:hypothetical protein
MPQKLPDVVDLKRITVLTYSSDDVCNTSRIKRTLNEISYKNREQIPSGQREIGPVEQVVRTKFIRE